MNKGNIFLNRAEVIDYLQVSEWKLKKLLSEEKLTPAKIVHTRYGKNAHLYNVFKVVDLKRKLVKEGYKYKYN